MNRKLSTGIIALLLCEGAFAQYTPMGTPTPGTPTPGSSTPIYSSAHKSYGVNKGAVGALAGAGVGAGVLYITKLRHPTMEGCVGPDGKSLVKNNGKSYVIVGDTLRPGERVVVTTKKMKDSSGAPAIDVLHMKKDLGQCQKEARSSPPSPPQ